MSHNITKNPVTGEFEVMTARHPAWHNLGTTFPGCVKWEDAARAGGLLHTVSRRQLQYNGIDVPAWALFRDDVHEWEKAWICNVSETQEIIQAQFMFEYMDILVEADGNAMYESCGSIERGSRIFACINLNQTFEPVPGDVSEAYLTFLDDRTGKNAARCFISLNRTVCDNTWHSNYSGAQSYVSFNHRGNMGAKMADAVELFQGARMNISMLEAKFKALADRKLTRDSMAAILDRLFPFENAKEEHSTRRENKVRSILELFENNDANAFPSIRGTGYNLLNAVTEYTDHVSSVRQTVGKEGMTADQIRSERAMFGAGAEWKRSALDIILEETEGADSVSRRAESVTVVADLLGSSYAATV